MSSVKFLRKVFQLKYDTIDALANDTRTLAFLVPQLFSKKLDVQFPGNALCHKIIAVNVREQATELAVCFPIDGKKTDFFIAG